MASDFKSFLHELGQQMGRSLEVSAGLLRVDLNGVPFMFAHDAERWGDENVLFACDFGAIPQERRCAILERLLAANSEMHGLWSPIFTIDPGTEHVMALSALPLEGLDSARTLQIMMRHVVLAAAWQRTYFLEPDAC